MKENYFYPARIDFSDGKYQVHFIDFPNMILAEESTKEDAIVEAQRGLALVILDYENSGKEFPEPDESETGVIYIHVWLPYYRNSAKEIYVKKNVTIPSKLDMEAKEKKLSYSAVLVNQLKRELGIDVDR